MENSKLQIKPGSDLQFQKHTSPHRAKHDSYFLEMYPRFLKKFMAMSETELSLGLCNLSFEGFWFH